MDTASFSSFDTVSGLIGGIGLFLLGMSMLTDGLKLAAGRALEDLLERGTSSRPRGLAAGVLITALVQSSTAVTVASIGFVNTGLLPLQNALWVIFGSNVGSTLNAWLVAALGFGLKIDTFALPFVGVGALLLPVDAACAIVIGTNVGTPSTAILAAIGATANARRLAAAHVTFNLVTGAVALLLLPLPLLIGLLRLLGEWFEEAATPPVIIAVFHTTFNLLGVLLMVPIADTMLRMLGARFRTREEEIARPRHLDRNSLAVPDLAVRALRLELGRTQAFASASLDAAASPRRTKSSWPAKRMR